MCVWGGGGGGVAHPGFPVHFCLCTAPSPPRSSSGPGLGEDLKGASCPQNAGSRSLCAVGEGVLWERGGLASDFPVGWTPLSSGLGQGRCWA